MIRYESGDARRGWITAEQVVPGDVIVSAHGAPGEIEITDVVPVDDPTHGRLPALRGWIGEREITDGRQIPGRVCGYRVGDMRDVIAYPGTTTWSKTSLD